MSTIKKHIGRIRNTDRRCVVVYMQIPGNPDQALVVDTDSLPDHIHDALQEVVQSHEGQSTVDLANLLARRIVPHMGADILNVLHSMGRLQRVNVDNVLMYPMPNNPMPLRQIIELNGGQLSKQVQVDQPDLQNRHAENHKATIREDQIAVAKNILMQASDLDEQARLKREQAYALAPSLRPAQTAQLNIPVVDGFVEEGQFQHGGPQTLGESLTAEEGAPKVTESPSGE